MSSRGISASVVRLNIRVNTNVAELGHGDMGVTRTFLVRASTMLRELVSGKQGESGAIEGRSDP